MAGKTVSGYVDDRIADCLNALARAESRSPANIVGQAIGFYAALPTSARNSLRHIETLASPDELRWFHSEFVRLLSKADMGLTQRRMAEEMSGAVPEVSDENEAEAVALEWTNGRDG